MSEGRACDSSVHDIAVPHHFSGAKGGGTAVVAVGDAIVAAVDRHVEVT